MYHNPSASSYTHAHHPSPHVLPFHQTLPSYSLTALLPLSLPPIPSNLSLYLKNESLRSSLPAFKILGASYASYRCLLSHLSLPPSTSFQDLKSHTREKRITLVAATDGNFGRAIAYMARLLGVAAKIYVPSFVAAATKDLIAGEGAEVLVASGDYDVAVRAAAHAAERDERYLLVQDDAWPGYEQVPTWVVEGYETMMQEIDIQILSPPDLIVVPVGVGSLAQATVSHFKASSRGKRARILAVEPECAEALKGSLEKGESTIAKTGETAMCGMCCGTVSSIAWPILQEGVDAAVGVSEEDEREAMALLREEGVHVGPCTAGSLAGLLKVLSRKEEARELGMDNEITVVILGTEGPR